jgi:hypothetical protein
MPAMRIIGSDQLMNRISFRFKSHASDVQVADFPTSCHSDRSGGMERAGTSDMDRWAARVAARELGDERVQSLTISEIFRDVSTPLDMTPE